MKSRKFKRAEEKKFKRIPVLFGLEIPEFPTLAIQISTRGLFLSTNSPIYAPGNKLVIEISTPKGSYTISAIVRRAKKMPPLLLHHERPGMGVEFMTISEEVRKYLASL